MQHDVILVNEIASWSMGGFVANSLCDCTEARVTGDLSREELADGIPRWFCDIFQAGHRTHTDMPGV
jgi:hypothetical protein